VLQVFDRGFGATAPAAARLAGSRVAARLVFGWSGLREKLLCAAHGLDDATLQALKVGMLRNGEATRLRRHSVLRLIGVTKDALMLRWLIADADPQDETLHVPRELYQEIAADPAWAPLRTEFAAGPFVGLDRLLVEA
jgi:hypothetical protein